MKKMKILLILISTLSFHIYSASFLPMGKYVGGNNVRLNIGGYGGLSSSSSGALPYDAGGGLSDLGAGIGISTSILNLLEIGADFKLGASSMGSLFSSEEKIKALSGLQVGADVLARTFFPLGLFDVGAQVVAGWNNGWSKHEKTVLDKHVPGWRLKVGPVLRFNVVGLLTLYTGVNFTVTNIKMNTEELVGDLASIKTLVNQKGLEIPLGVMLSLGGKLGMFGEIDTLFENFNDRDAGYKGIANIGISMAI